MDGAQRETIIAAHDAWRNAHRAYRDEVAKYVVWHMESGTSPGRNAEPLTPKTIDKLTQLHKAEGAALAAYRDVLGET
jgi:hypothetical protein